MVKVEYTGYRVQFLNKVSLFSNETMVIFTTPTTIDYYNKGVSLRVEDLESSGFTYFNRAVPI